LPPDTHAVVVDSVDHCLIRPVVGVADLRGVRESVVRAIDYK
jgi:hypothetical protein